LHLKLQTKKIISDRGTAFTSDEFKKYCEDEGIELHAVTTGVPRANGQVERLNATIVSVLSKLSLDDPSKWYKFVNQVQQTINSTYCRSTHTTPFELLVGIKMRTKTDVLLKEMIEQELIQMFQDNRDEIRKAAKQQILVMQNENKHSYNLRRRPAATYEVGDIVAIKRTQLGGGLKLKPKYLGPYRVTKVKPKDTYDVVKESLTTDGPRYTTSCAEYMKTWMSISSEDDDDTFGTNV